MVFSLFSNLGILDRSRPELSPEHGRCLQPDEHGESDELVVSHFEPYLPGDILPILIDGYSSPPAHHHNSLASPGPSLSPMFTTTPPAPPPRLDPQPFGEPDPGFDKTNGPLGGGRKRDIDYSPDEHAAGESAECAGLLARPSKLRKTVVSCPDDNTLASTESLHYDPDDNNRPSNDDADGSKNINININTSSDDDRASATTSTAGTDDPWATAATSSDELGRVGNGRWLSDSLVNIMARFLEAHHHNWVSVDPLVLGEVAADPSAAHPALQPLASVTEAAGVTPRIFALAFRSQHWSLVWADISSGRLHVYDSKPGLNPEYMNWQQKSMRSLLTRILPAGVLSNQATSPSIQSWPASRVAGPQQDDDDSDNCGVFAIVAAWALTAGLELAEVSVDPSVWRAILAALLQKTAVYGLLPYPGRPPTVAVAHAHAHAHAHADTNPNPSPTANPRAQTEPGSGPAAAAAAAADDIETWVPQLPLLSGAGVTAAADACTSTFLAIMERKRDFEARAASLGQITGTLRSAQDILCKLHALSDSEQPRLSAALTRIRKDEEVARAILHDTKRLVLTTSVRSLVSSSVAVLDDMKHVRRDKQRRLAALKHGWERVDALDLPGAISSLECRMRACCGQAEELEKLRLATLERVQSLG